MRTGMGTLSLEHCQSYQKGTPALSTVQVSDLITQVPGWTVEDGQASIQRTFPFENFYQTMAFANAVGFISNRQDHHPTLEISYKQCRVTYTTHSVGGLSRNDFICASRINALLE